LIGAFLLYSFFMMKYNYKIIAFLFFICSTNTFIAQTKDSLIEINAEYKFFLNSDKNAFDLLFYKHNNDVLLNDLGPYGSANYYLTSNNISKHNIFFNSFGKNKLENLKGIKPFTNLTYINASRREQFFSISHIQQFGKLMNLEFDFRKISSPGEYFNQEANYTSFKSALGYKSKKGNYLALLKIDINRHRNEENGGLDSLSLENFSDNPLENTVNLTRSDVVIKKYTYELNQRLNLLSLHNDSLNTGNIYVNMFNKYSSNERVFNDNDPLSMIYDTVFGDSLSSIDSIYQRHFLMDLSLGYSNRNIDVAFLGSLERVNYFQTTYILHQFLFGLKINF